MQRQKALGDSGADKGQPACWGQFKVALSIIALAISFTLAAATTSSPSSPGKAPEPLPLAEAERLHLAEIEHRALTLAKKGFPAFKAALREAEAAKLGSFFAPSFRGEIIDLAKGHGPISPAVKIHRESTSDANPKSRAASGEAFVRYLLSLRKKFAADPQIEIKLVELTPVQRTNYDGPWSGSFKFRRAGRFPGGGPAEIFLEMTADFLRLKDVDEIAKDTGWIASLRVFEAYEATAEKDLLADVAKEPGLNPELLVDNWTLPGMERSVVNGGVFVADIDNDGRQDVLITDLNGIFLFRGLEGGKFSETTSMAGLPRKWAGVSNVAFADFDNDGWVDLILESRVFRNVGDVRFAEITQQTTLKLAGSLKYTSGYAIGDFDKDGKLDLYVARSHGPKGGRDGNNSWIDGPGGPGNQLWRNLGNWKFEEVSDIANARAGRRSSFTAAWLDANNDGWPDIYVINEFGGGVLLVNQGNGTFKEVNLLDDAGDFGSMGLAVADFDNDGNIDVYAANMYSKSGRRIINNLAPAAYPPPIMAKMKRFFPGSEL